MIAIEAKYVGPVDGMICLFLKLVLEMSKRIAPDVVNVIASWQTSIANTGTAEAVMFLFYV